MCFISMECSEFDFCKNWNQHKVISVEFILLSCMYVSHTYCDLKINQNDLSDLVLICTESLCQVHSTYFSIPFTMSFIYLSTTTDNSFTSQKLFPTKGFLTFNIRGYIFLYKSISEHNSFTSFNFGGELFLPYLVDGDQ